MSSTSLPTPQAHPSAPHPSTLKGTRLFFLHLSLHPSAHEQKPHGAIYTCRPDGSDLNPLLNNLGTHPDGLFVDPQRSHVYYSNMGVDPSAADGSICRVGLDGSDNTVLVAPPLKSMGRAFTPKQLIMDRSESTQGQHKLYWCDREGGRIWRADVNGENPECLYVAGPRAEFGTAEDELNHCVGIAVDAARGKMLWTQKGPTHGGVGRLFEANIQVPQGETPETRSDVVVLQDKLPEPIDLEWDLEERVVYKTDRGTGPRGNTVSRLHLDKGGKVVEEVLVKHLHDAIGVAIDKPAGMMYFTDIGGSVYSAKMDGSDVKEILKDMGDLTGIWVANFD